MANRTDLPNSSRVDLSTEEDQKTTEIKDRCHSRDFGIEREEGPEVLGGKSQETPAIPEDELGDFQCSSFESDTYEVIECDLNEIRIAGFSKQELLEMCNFCKISYGSNDKKLDSRYKTKAELINEGYGIIPFYYNERNKRCAGFVFTKDKEITIAYRGTKDFDDVMTDVSTAFTSEFLPEGGKMHDGFHNAFYDSLPSLGKILDGYAEEQGSEIKDFKINCTGHSMGAALATITALYLKKVKEAGYVRVATFGSPRVFNFHGAEIYEKLLGENTIRVTNSSDPIPMFPSGSMGFKHVGKPLKIKTGNFVINCLGMSFCIVGEYYHKTDTYYSCIQDIKPEDFQSNNSVSRYYYLSYVAAVPYYITTTALTIPYYLFPSVISNTEQRYFEREMKFADDRRLMSLKDNKNGLVIHALGNAMVSLENPLIISHIECNINGRDEGLKFNIYDIASFVNSNYHLNRSNMKLRQLCEIEDVPVKGVPNLIDAENHVPGSRNTISDLVNEPATSSRAVNEAGSKQLQNPKPKSASSQQPQKNAVDKGKNIMNNGHASTKHLVSNNCKGGEMDNGNKNKNIKEKLSGAIESIDPNTVERLLNQEDTNITESILKEALDQAVKRIENLKEGDKKQDQKDRLTQIIELLETKLKSIGGAAPSVDDSAATGSQVTPAAEPKESEGDQPGSPSLSPQSSVSSAESSGSSSSFVKLPESDTENSNGEYVKIPSGSGSGSSFEEVGEDENVPTPKSSSPQDIQPGISTSKPSDTGAEGSATVSSAKGDKKKQTPVQPAKGIAQIDDDDDYGLSWLFSEEGDQILHPENPEPEPTLSSTSKKSEQVNNTTPQNTESSNLHIIAASALAIVGVALGVAIAVHLEMLAVGILVGACCLVAAAVIYCCGPQNSVKDSEIEKVSSKEKEPVSV
ncbi:MAG: lipase family protein [Rickettsiales bacterium]|jgi:hypothetical protein|nr:lipase family protein [Rickettsiales bacterium]MDR1261488.1 lipase family protein [Rickettsiales bacterium]